MAVTPSPTQTKGLAIVHLFNLIHGLSLKAPLFLQHRCGNMKYAVNILDLCSFVHILQLLPVSILGEAHAELVDSQLGRQPGDS